MKWTAIEIDYLKDWYRSRPLGASLKLDDLASELGRHKTNICRKAKQLGLTQRDRPKTGVRKITLRQFATDAERNAATGERIKKYIADNGHPRGATGLQHTPESRAKMSATIKKAWERPTSKYHTEADRQRRSDLMMKRNREHPQAHPFSRAKDGRRADLNNQYFRSAWEANYARYLNFLVKQKAIIGWEYECQTFWFETIKRGVRSYKPDFKVKNNDGSHEWHEVKGWMTPKGATAIKRFKKYYPDEKHILVDAKWFASAKKQGLPSLVGNWE